MKSLHKRETEEDKFTRKYSCDHHRIGYVRYIKKANNRKLRRLGKEEIEHKEKEE